jgi:YHS domain-containing protein
MIPALSARMGFLAPLPVPANPRAASLRRWFVRLLLPLMAVLAGCSAMQAQNPSGRLQPVNAVPGGDGQPLMLKGHDVVAYFTEQRHRMGLAQHRSVYEGVVFQFASAEHKRLFDAAPDRYLPQFGGYCANGIVYAIPWGGDADSWVMHEGKLYIFGGQGSRDAFLLDVPGNLALAQRYWTEEMAGGHSFLQRAKRMVLRVPHYKSGSELAAMVAAARQKKP